MRPLIACALSPLVTLSCGGALERMERAGGGVHPGADAPVAERAPFERSNAVRLRVVVLIHRSRDLAGSFVEAQNAYPPRGAVDRFAHAVEQCYDRQFDRVVTEADSFGRHVGDLTFDATCEHAHLEKAVLSHTTFHDPELEACVRSAMAETTLSPDESSELHLEPSSDAVRVEVQLTNENRYYVREVRAEKVERPDLIKFRETDPRIVTCQRAGASRRLAVSGIRCSEGGTYIAEKVLGAGRALLEREPDVQPGIDFTGWTEAYVRLPDGRDYGLELITSGICRDSGEPHPRSQSYRAAERQRRVTD